MGKRTFDVLMSSVALVVLAPLWIVGAMLVKATSPGPVLYRAPRAGRDGAPFDMFKFRTMRIDEDAADRRVTEPNDDRITLAGRILRKSRVDEIPQLINVLSGQMSLVGPRPEDVGIVETNYTQWHRRSLKVRPGVVCYAEVRWYPDLTHHDPPPVDVAMQDWYVQRHLAAQVAAGIEYAENSSLAIDIKILARLLWLTARYAFASPPIIDFEPVPAVPGVR